MIRLLGRKLLLLLLLIPALHAGGYLYAVTHPQQPRQDEIAPYTTYAAEVLTGQIGQVGSGSITEIVGNGIRHSLILIGIALLLTAILGPVLGFLSISPRTRRMRPLAMAITTAGASLPGFFLGVATISAMIYGIFTVTQGRTPLPISGYGLDEHLVLPVLVLSAGAALQVARVAAGLLENELHQEYVRVAQSKGLSWRGIYLRHALANVISAVALTIGRSTRVLISGLIVVEALFLWPGLGRIFTYAIGIRIDGREPLEYFLHPPLLATLAVVFGVALLLADIIASMIAYGADPRLLHPSREQGVAA